MSSADVSSLLSLSTAHLSLATRAQLDEWCGNIDLTRKGFCADGPPTLMGATDHGWLVYAAEDTEGFPADLATCLQYARNEDCAYVLFDADGNLDSSLPVPGDDI